ncbi:AMP-dependent synthetase/ligase [Salisaeta longa]|uniref:AMP-dependent synthetase/ligase n=1 Tax=Salisaeta longa TaxID=503170 RepID=UPI0003B38FF3|nr:long-chain fatty acid--CoA ligase [Salisaeta longa]
MPSSIHTAPATSGPPILGKTIPDLLYDACAQYENPTALNQPTNGSWTPTALEDFRIQAEEIALGLLDLGFTRGARIAFLLESDVHFCRADMGCLLAGLVDVPVYLSTAPEQMAYVIDHAEAEALIVANDEQLAVAQNLLPELERIRAVVVPDPGPETERASLPEGVELYTMDAVRAMGRDSTDDQDAAIADLRQAIATDDLATLIYTSGTTGQPKGVMLTHENISFNAMTSLSELTNFKPGPSGEVVLSFLPLTHIFARTLQYAFMAMGVSIHFTNPDDLVDALPKVQPTAFASVPRVLEKVYAGIQKKIMGMEGLQKSIGTWAMGLARQYAIGEQQSLVYNLQRTVADQLVFKKWRAALGGRVKYIVIGGAALQPSLANTLAAAGITTLQGYGLTETSPVISFTRPEDNVPGTVGKPLPGVEVMIADDGEILTRGPHVMQGYYKAEDKTAAVMSGDDWFHTGDVGEFDANGNLKITDRKKDLFKLSTGKYVMPQPIENKLGSEPLVDKAVVVGNSRKFCAALIFPTEDQVRAYAKEMDLDSSQPFADLLEEPAMIEQFQQLVDNANEGMDHWSTVKRFALIPDELTIESGLLTPTLKVKRPQMRETYAEEIEALYADDADTPRTTAKQAVIVA